VRLPKAARLEDVVALDQALGDRERRNGLALRSVAVALTIESARGLVGVRSLARGPRVRHLCFGAADLARDLGVEPGADELELLLAKQELVIASRAAGLEPPVASAHTNLADPAGLERTTLQARRLGFFGRSCIHPKQLRTVHEAFAPDAAAIEAALRVSAAWAEALSIGSASTTTADGRFVDRAVARAAEATLALAKAFSNPDQRRVP
jgi:citrate lyase subunit beta/citryl-CoA lyase